MTGNDMVGSGARTAAAVSAANAPAAPASPLPDAFSSTASAANAAAAASSGAAPCQCRSPERLASCAFACARPGRGRHHREHTPRTGLGQHWLQFMEYRARPALASIYGVRGPARSAPHTCTNAAPLCAQRPAPRTTMATAAAPNGTPASSAACTMRPSARCRSLSASPSAPPAPAPGQPRRACTELYGNAATSFASCRGAGARSRAAGFKVVTQHMV